MTSATSKCRSEVANFSDYYETFYLNRILRPNVGPQKCKVKSENTVFFFGLRRGEFAILCLSVFPKSATTATSKHPFAFAKVLQYYEPLSLNHVLRPNLGPLSA